MNTEVFGIRFRSLVIAALFFVAAPAVAHPGGESIFLAPQPPAADATLVSANGIVNELRVENRVSGVTTRYLWLRLDDGATVALRGPSLDALIPGQRVEVTGRNAGETLFVTGAQALPTVSTVPAKATKASAPVALSVEGKLALAHADYFNEGRGEYSVHVISEDGTATVLQLAVVPDVLQIGMSVIAEGTLAADGVSLQASRITVLSPPLTTNDVLQAPITNNVLVILIKFTDSPAADPFTQAQVDQVTRTNAGSVANYYNEVSYGQQLLNVTVTNWLPAGAATPASCNYSTVGSLANTAATAAGYNLANYTNKFYVMPYNASCGWLGLAYVGFPYTAWSNGNNSVGVYGHELGHNFTLYHAGSLGCTGQVIGGSCSVAEYGDPFDIMGNSTTMHFNAMQKSRLNWIPASSVKTHSSGNAIYTLSPLESAGQSTYAVKIPAAANRTYWLEYRQPIGFDAPMSSYPNNGAQIRVASPLQFISGADDTEILDMTLGTPGNFGDAALLVGQSYADSTYGISINVLSATPSALTLSVTLGGASPTSTTLASSLNPSTVGASLTFTATVTGTVPTGSVNFKDGGSSISGCSAVTLTGSGNAPTAACTTSGLAVGTHTIVAVYSGDAGNAGSSSGPLSQVVNQGISSSTTTLTSSLNPSTVGTSVSFTASVTGAAPTGSVNFKDGGTSIAGCSAVALTGAGNTRTAACTTSSLSAGTHSIVAAYGGDAGNAASSSAPLSQLVNASGQINVALASNGGVASASSTYAGQWFTVAAVNDGERTGANWGNGGAWKDGTIDVWPDWVEIDFNGSKTIDHVVLYTLQDNYTNPVEPTDTMTFSSSGYGITDFMVEAWNGTNWIILSTVAGNNLVKRTVNFPPYTTDRIRITVTNGLNSCSRITEIEAWGTAAAGPPPTTTSIVSSTNPSTVGSSVIFTASVTGAAPTGSVNFKDSGTSIAGCSAVALTGAGNTRTAACTTSSLSAGTHSIVAAYGGDAGNAASSSAPLSQLVNASGQINVALASNGGVASASSTYAGQWFTVAAVNDGERTGANWGNGGAWKDGTPDVWPDWVRIDFNGSKTIDHVVLYTLQDNYTNPVEPTDTMTFSSSGYGITDFMVEAWNGTNWIILNTVAGNNLVKRTVNFPPYTTDRIRITVTNALNSCSRITEIEAWGTAAAGPPPTTTSIVSSTNPSTVGSSVIFTASVTGAAPTGSVNFKDGGTSIAGCSAVALTGAGNTRTAACTTSSLSAGTHSIVAAYGGDAGNAASSSAPLSQLVNASGQINVALASNGGVASASSTYAGQWFTVAAVNDGERTGANWGNGGAWKDGTIDVWPDWVEIDFNGSKTIDHVVLYTLQDNYTNPVEPTDTMTFSSSGYGITDFMVEAWNGTNWIILNTVAGNNLVKRTVNFPPYTTDRIRITVTNALNSCSRITEIEAWGN